jgi:hypothetical protein
MATFLPVKKILFSKNKITISQCYPTVLEKELIIGIITDKWSRKKQDFLKNLSILTYRLKK